MIDAARRQLRPILPGQGESRGGDGGNYRRNAVRELERFAEWAAGDRGDDDWTGIVPDDGRAFSIREYDPWEFDTRAEATLEWEEKTRGCHFVEEYGNHNWSQISGYAHPDGYEYEYCWWCRTRRRYDDELTGFVYDYGGVLAPEVDIEVLRNAVIPHSDVANDFDD